MIPTSRPWPSTIGTPGDLEPPHQRVRLAQRTIRPERDRVHDHPALAPLDPVDFRGLPLDRHVLVQHADAAGSRHGDGHVRLGDGVHGGGDQRDVERDRAGEAGDGGNLARVDRGVPRQEEHVVEGEPELGADGTHRRHLAAELVPLYTTAHRHPERESGGPWFDRSISNTSGQLRLNQGGKALRRSA